MTPLNKLAITCLITSLTPICNAMETENSLKEGLEYLLNKSPDDAFLLVTESPEGASPGFPTRYTRNTNFKENRWGNFVNTDGEYLQIFHTDEHGNPTAADTITTTELVTVSPKLLCDLTPKPTTSIKLRGINLSATSPIGTECIVPLRIWGNYGDSHIINLKFTRAQNNPITWHFTAIPSDQNTVTIDPPYAQGFPLLFDNFGNIASINGSMLAGNNTPPISIHTHTQLTWWPYHITMHFGLDGGNTGIKCTGTSSDTSTAPCIDGHGPLKYIRSIMDKKTGHLIAELATLDDKNDIKNIYGKIPVATIEIPKINLF